MDNARSIQRDQLDLPPTIEVIVQIVMLVAFFAASCAVGYYIYLDEWPRPRNGLLIGQIYLAYILSRLQKR